MYPASQPGSKRHTLSVLVENRPGVLARIAGLFARRAFNINSLSVSPTERPDISRVTVTADVDEVPLEQIIKQLNRSVEVIKVIDFTDIPIRKKELLYIKVNSCSEKDKQEIFRIVQTFGMEIVDYDKNTVLVECVKTEAHNNDMIELFKKTFINRVEVVRGGSVAIEAISTCVR